MDKGNSQNGYTRGAPANRTSRTFEIVLIVLLIGALIRACFNAVFVFDWTDTNIDIHYHGSVPLLYSVMVVSVLHTLDWVQHRINRKNPMSLAFVLKCLLLVTGLVFGISFTNYNWVDLTP